MKIGSLFSGYGGLDMAAEAVFGGTTAWHSEVDQHASKVLALRWPGVPNLGDIAAVDWSTVEPVDVIAGGFPCQDISSAGRGAGIKEGTRSGLWYRYADAVRVLRPRFVFVENVGALVVRGLDIVLGDLAALGYDAEWTSLRASDVGAPHRRERIFLLAWPATGHSERPGLQGFPGAGLNLREPSQADSGAAADADHPAIDGQRPRPEPGGRGEAPADADPAASSDGHARSRQADQWPTPDRALRRGTWGPYAAAVARWEHITGHPTPSPTDERGRLNAPFAEWMMGLPPGWVTGPDVTELGVPRSAMLRMIGNGVVPRQAEAAARILLERACSPRAIAS